MAGKLVGWLEDQGQSSTADWVLVLALGGEKRRGLGPLAVGEDEEEDQGGPVPAGLRGGGSRKQLTRTGPGWDMGACPPPVPALGGGGALPPEQVPKDWASVGCGWRCPSLCVFRGPVEAELTGRDQAGGGVPRPRSGGGQGSLVPQLQSREAGGVVPPAGGLCATPPGSTGCPHTPASCCGWRSSVLCGEAPLRASPH